MKNVLDIFLKQNGLTRYDLSKKVGISEQTLSKASKRDPETYSGKTLIAISKGTNHSPGEVLDQLLTIRDSDLLYTASNLKEIRQKVKEQEDEFIIQGEFNSILKDIKKSTLSENEQLGFNLGTAGLGTSVVWIINRIFNSIDSNKEEENLKTDIAMLYQIKLLNSNEAKLRLKQSK
ncbi:helix-turn-helix transcriptional regulator [Lapidilactobacillus luobeiensis]|uniref:helix-turn-helix transcriptional regulator n=1 Tax=Lapidilactobacillus luobeiensis TaxID=2950371 RepID=UPI0021C3A955|nr:helix-turn-helix transcriptional regulator [Lapidilactobacillus luobeiensis]